MTRFPFFRALTLLTAAYLACTHDTGAHAETLTTPLTIAGVPVAEVVTGYTHTCARGQDGRVHCWGNNAMGQLGNNSTISRTTPVQVGSRLADAIQIVAGGDHSCALRANGSVACWGGNYEGQLGDGTTTNRLTPVAVVGLTNIVQITAGNAHTCALRANGRVFCWGDNHDGQLGDGTTIQRETPVPLTGLWSKGGVAQIAAGSGHTCLLRENGRVACWGSNHFGQLGDGTVTDRLTPVVVENLLRIVQLSAGAVHNCALRQNGRVFCWGYNESGRLGHLGMEEFSATPVRVQDLSLVSQVAAGGNHSCALRQNGRLFCWGANSSGQLGDGTNTQRLTPVRVLGLNNAVDIATGGSFSCGVRQDGLTRCWGRNSHGQIGDGTTLDRWNPVNVPN